MYKLTQERLKEVLAYNKETGEFWWKVKTGNRTSFTKPAGNRNIINGYVIISIDCHRYCAHRLAWFYETGEWPKSIDHINRERHDNRLANLREATHAQQIYNSQRNKSKTGFRGVAWNAKANRWVAQTKVDGKSIYLGLHDTPEAAYKAYCNFVEKIAPGFLAPNEKAGRVEVEICSSDTLPEKP